MCLRMCHMPCVCRYAFATPSTLKPTQWHYPSGSINQIPGTATICGDMRITPFYDVEEVGGLGSTSTTIISMIMRGGSGERWVKIVVHG